MQSSRPSPTEASRLPARICAAMVNGNRPQGQALTQLAQRMHGISGLLCTSSELNASKPLLPFTTGTRRLGKG